MAQEVLKQIQELEKQAQKKTYDAREEAENMIAEAKRKAKQHHEARQLQYQQKEKEMKEAAVQQGIQNSSVFAEETKKMVETLHEKLAARELGAVDIVIEALQH